MAPLEECGYAKQTKSATDAEDRLGGCEPKGANQRQFLSR